MELIRSGDAVLAICPIAVPGRVGALVAARPPAGMPYEAQAPISDGLWVDVRCLEISREEDRTPGGERGAQRDHGAETSAGDYRPARVQPREKNNKERKGARGRQGTEQNPRGGGKDGR